jgi:hypothetical protein
LEDVTIICRIDEYREGGYLPLHFCHLRRMFANIGIGLSYFLEFVRCEFEAGTYHPLACFVSLLTDTVAYMVQLFGAMRASGPDGSQIADHSSLEVGCLRQSCQFMTYNNRSANANRSKRNWGYTQDWTGPFEFELPL